MPLDRQVEFRTDFFLPMVDEQAETNPGVYGKALATWVKAKLEERGVQAEDIIPEDFGWVVSDFAKAVSPLAWMRKP